VIIDYPDQRLSQPMLTALVPLLSGSVWIRFNSLRWLNTSRPSTSLAGNPLRPLRAVSNPDRILLVRDLSVLNPTTTLG
jgi:hypothetical protein